ncbi:hypothetical protein ACS0TY_022084 [Phlomoides rotata]
MGVYFDGSYNVPSGLIYSFPVTCKNGEWSIVQGLSIDEYSRNKSDLTAKELSEEKELAYSCFLKPPGFFAVIYEFSLFVAIEVAVVLNNAI